jgi:pyridoxamine 5'-phosphate oxidase
VPFEDVPADPSLADPLPGSPFPLLGRWLDEAREGRVQRNPTAMSLATVSQDGHPTLRVVLCRGFEADPGYLVFYTDRGSRKGRALASTPRAAASFHWDALQRQVRIEGPVVHSPDDESDRYFAGRPRPSQVAAWTSRQSEPVASRAAFLDMLEATQARYPEDAYPTLPRPPAWGGYRLFVERIELWVGSLGRAHDRGLWTRTLAREGDGFRGSEWTVERLQP